MNKTTIVITGPMKETAAVMAIMQEIFISDSPQHRHLRDVLELQVSDYREDCAPLASTPANRTRWVIKARLNVVRKVSDHGRPAQSRK